MSQKSLLALSLIVLLLAIIVTFIAFSRTAEAPEEGTNNTETEESNNEVVFCTADAMQCPDGSYVGRSGPNCEFVCPD